jgi:hypothetical protein
MALTFTKRISMNMDISGKLFRVYEITHDGSETSIDASDLEMHYVEAAIAGPGTQVLSATSTAYCDLTTTYGASLAMTALSSGATTVLWAIGH